MGEINCDSQSLSINSEIVHMGHTIF